jgi:hypothetical protein
MVVLSLSIIIIIPSFVRSSAGKGLNHLLVDSCDGLDAWLRFTAFLVVVGVVCGVCGVVAGAVHTRSHFILNDVSESVR